MLPLGAAVRAVNSGLHAPLCSHIGRAPFSLLIGRSPDAVLSQKSLLFVLII